MWRILGLVASIGGAVAFWRYYYFFRDPERAIPPGRNIVSPADGIIVYARAFTGGGTPIAVKKKREIQLTEITKSPLTIDSGIIIGIYMGLWDVHTNRSPIDGTVDDVIYRPAAANRSMALFGFQTTVLGRPTPGAMGHIVENERNTIRICGDFVVYVVQIADFYVNKVACWVVRGQRVEKGERIGQIVMGSQVDLILPEVPGLALLVKEGDRVKAGETALATY
jgi:phosphatidylserine decarboxylase